MDQKLFLVFAYAVFMALLGIFFSKNKTIKDFLIAGRSNSGLVMAAGMVIASIDAFWFTLVSGMGYMMGWGLIWLIVADFLSFGILALVARKIKERSTEQDMITLTDWFHHHYGANTGYVTGFIIVACFLGWLTGVIVSTGIVMSTLFGVDYNLIILCVVAIVIPMLLKGGYASLTQFDVVQFFIVGAGLVAVYLFGFKDISSVRFSSFDTVGSLGLWGTVSLMIAVFSGVVAGGDIWQRMYAAKDSGEVVKGFGWASVLFAVAILVIGGLGMMAKEAGFEGSENDVFGFVTETLWNEAIRPVLLIIFLAAATSTLNMIIFGGSSSLAKDFRRKGLSDDVLYKRVRIIMILVTIGCAGAALLTRDIMGIAMAVMSSTTCYSPLLLINLLTPIKISNVVAFLSVLCALVLFIGLTVTGYMTPEYAGLPIFANLIVIAVAEPLVRLIRKKAVV